ncbi:hypothetical protein ACXR0M_24320 [Pseudomonas sp. Eth.TT006]
MKIKATQAIWPNSAALRNPELEEDVEVIVDIAKLTRGLVTTNDQIELLQWLKFHRYTIPQTGEQANTLLGFLQLVHPASPASGSYRECCRLALVFKLDKLLPTSYTRRIVKDALPVSFGKLHHAATVLKNPGKAADSGLVVKMLMGDNSPAARQELLTRIEEVMVDAAKVTPDIWKLSQQRHADVGEKDPGIQ